MNVKISATHEGKCDFCKKKKMVFSAGDEDTQRGFSICKDCSPKYASEKLTDMIEKHGKKNEQMFKPAVRYEGKSAAG